VNGDTLPTTHLTGCCTTIAATPPRTAAMIQFDGHPATVCSLAFSPDSMTLASGAKDGSLKLWDAAAGLFQAVTHHGEKPVAALAWHPTGNRLTFGAGIHLATFRIGSTAPAPGVPLGWAIAGLSFVTDTLLGVVLGGHETNSPGRLHLWDEKRRATTPLSPPVAGSQRTRAVDAHPPTKRLHWIAGLPNTTACVWRSWCITSPNATDVKLGKPAADIGVSPDGGTVAIACDWVVRVFTADGKPKADLTGHKGQVAGVGFVHGGRTVASASWDETVRFWDVATGQETARFPLTVGKLTALAVSPDGTRVAVGGTDGPIVVIDAE
jgi:WD40 repeat protein